MLRVVRYRAPRFAIRRGILLAGRLPASGGRLGAEVAQLAEHSPEKAGVDSSILSLGTIFRAPLAVSKASVA